MLILIIGDLYIPFKSSGISPLIQEQLQPGKVQHIICTGNICVKSELEYFKTICPEMSIIRGEFDEAGISNSDESILAISGLKVGIISSYSISPINDINKLASKQRELDVDILIHGGTHQASAIVKDECLYIDPGSATGIPSKFVQDTNPSFILLNIQGTLATAYIYKLIDDSITIEEVSFSPQSSKPD